MARVDVALRVGAGPDPCESTLKTVHLHRLTAAHHSVRVRPDVADAAGGRDLAQECGLFAIPAAHNRHLRGLPRRARLLLGGWLR